MTKHSLPTSVQYEMEENQFRVRKVVGTAHPAQYAPPQMVNSHAFITDNTKVTVVVSTQSK